MKAVGGGFEIFTLYSDSNQIVEETSLSNIFETKELSFDYLGTFFAWGLSKSDGSLPDLVGVYRSAQNSVNPYFNSFKFVFSTSRDTPINLKLRITLDLNEANSQILQGSITENLPSYSESEVRCRVQTGTIQCDNVGTLKGSYEYYIALKIMFEYALPAVDLGATFGTLRIQSLSDESTLDTLDLVQGTRDASATWGTSNVYDISSNAAGNGFTFAHS